MIKFLNIHDFLNLGVIEINDQCRMGHHVLINLFGVTQDISDNQELLKDMLIKSAVDNGFTIIGDLFHKFEPQGFTGILLLSESHIAVHTWPEHSSIAIDILSCTGLENAMNIINRLKSSIPHERHEIKVLKR